MSGKITILATAPVGATVSEEAAKYDMQLDVIPFIDVSAVESEVLAQTIDKLASQQQTVVFTSANGVTAVGDRILGKTVNWLVYCLGNKTKGIANQYFGKNKTFSECSDAAELAEAIVRDGVKEVVFFCGDKRMDTLPDTLKSASIDVTEVVVYKTVATAQKVSATYDAVLFLSPSGVESFFSLNTVKDDAVMFAIGNTTASEIRRYTGNRVVVSGRADREDLVRAAIGYFRQSDWSSVRCRC